MRALVTLWRKKQKRRGLLPPEKREKKIRKIGEAGKGEKGEKRDEVKQKCGLGCALGQDRICGCG